MVWEVLEVLFIYFPASIFVKRLSVGGSTFHLSFLLSRAIKELPKVFSGPHLEQKLGSDQNDVIGWCDEPTLHSVSFTQERHGWVSGNRLAPDLRRSSTRHSVP